MHMWRMKIQFCSSKWKNNGYKNITMWNQSWDFDFL